MYFNYIYYTVIRGLIIKGVNAKTLMLENIKITLIFIIPLIFGYLWLDALLFSLALVLMTFQIFVWHKRIMWYGD